MPLSEGDRIKLRVWHHTAIRFEEPVAGARIELHVSPVDTGLQSIWEHSITVIPDAPAENGLKPSLPALARHLLSICITDSDRREQWH